MSKSLICVSTNTAPNCQVYLILSESSYPESRLLQYPLWFEDRLQTVPNVDLFPVSRLSQSKAVTFVHLPGLLIVIFPKHSFSHFVFNLRQTTFALLGSSFHKIVKSNKIKNSSCFSLLSFYRVDELTRCVIANVTLKLSSNFY